MGRTQTKTIKNSVIFPLMYITNISFQTGAFTRELKIANVVPIFKAGDEMFFTNYRPVSVLPVFSKILERLYNRLIEYINKNNLLYKYQLGFQKGKSTYMAVLTLGLALLTLSWDKNWDSHSLVNSYPSFYPRIVLVAPSPGRQEI